MTSKLRIKVGEVEIDVEGSEDFLKAEVPILLKAAMDLAKAAPAATNAPNRPSGTTPPGDPNLSGTTTTIAAKLSVNTGPKLLIAAAAHLTLVARKETFTREDLLEQMRGASRYYKNSYGSNLSQSLATAISQGNLIENTRNVYALSAKARAELEAKLANG
jgi:hypothetical protein